MSARRGAGPPGTLVAFHHAELSGPFHSLERPLRWLAEEGPLDVVVPAPGRVAEAMAAGARVTVLDYSPFTVPRGAAALARASAGFVRDVRAFRRLLRERRPGLVVAVTSTLPPLLAAARLERLPAIADVREILVDGGTGGRGRELAGRALIATTARLSTRITACSERVAGQFRGTAAARVRTIHPPIEPRYAEGDGPRFRAAVGLGPDDRCLLAVGNLTRGRGQDVLIRAMPALRRELPGARCVLVGAPFDRPQDRAYAEEIAALVARLGLAEAVLVTGEREGIADAYAAADLVVNPARFPEPFGRVGPEALLAGTPVVAAAVGAIPEVLRDGETALLVPPDDPERLAAAALELLRDPGLARRLAEAGGREVRARFSPERALSAFREVVAEARAARWG